MAVQSAATATHLPSNCPVASWHGTLVVAGARSQGPAGEVLPGHVASCPAATQVPEKVDSVPTTVTQGTSFGG